VTKNACNSMRLTAAISSQSVKHSISHLAVAQWDSRESPSNATPVASGECSAEPSFNSCAGHMSKLLTGFRRPRRATQAFRSCQTIALVGIHERPAPKRPYSYKTWITVLATAAPTGMRENAQIVSNRRYRYDCTCRNRQFIVNLSGQTDNGFREGQDIIFLGRTMHFNCDRIKPQGFLERRSALANK
jgi:hypothetical protein